mmetsp:Transcript_6664/g.8722  ORF Transcript_6664/g.8722 Transcript_6664/m.8722 type:complete len:742 (-) Transcript_6664:1576-3801(-)
MALSSAELESIQNSLGQTATVLSSGVARLHLASPDPTLKNPEPDSILRTFPNLNNREWTDSTVTGGLVLVIDRQNRSVLFQIYDLESMELRFETELYENIEYNQMNNQFHAFEMKDCIAGFQFADARVGAKFYAKVNKSRPVVKSIKLKKSKGNGSMWNLRPFRRKSRRKDSLEIGEVMMVEHKGHMGLDSNGGFDLNNIPAEWKQMFRKAGIRKADLKDADTAKQVIETIQNHEMNQMYQAQPEYQGYTPEELESMYTVEHRQQYMNYQKELHEYQKQIEARKAEEEALAAWEKNNQTYNQAPTPPPKGDTQAPALPPRKNAEPPPPPPRKRQGPGKAVTQFDLELAGQQKKQVTAEAERLVNEAEAENRAAEERARKKKEELERKRKAELEKRQEEEAELARQRNAARVAEEKEKLAAKERAAKEQKDAETKKFAEELARAKKEAEAAKKAAEQAKLERDQILLTMQQLETQKNVNKIDDILDEAKHKLEVAKYNQEVVKKEIEEMEEMSAPPVPAVPQVPNLPALPKLPAMPAPPAPAPPVAPALPALPALPKLPPQPKNAPPATPKAPPAPNVPAIPTQPKSATAKLPPPGRKPSKTPAPKANKPEPMQTPKPKSTKPKMPEPVVTKRKDSLIRKNPSGPNLLLKGIEKGITLKPAPQQTNAPKTIAPPPNLMISLIQKGVQLRKTTVEPQKAKKKSIFGQNEQNAILIAKLAEAIRGNVHQDYEDDSDDDWSDDDY